MSRPFHRVRYALLVALARVRNPLGGEPTILIVLGALVGVAAGLGAVLFVRLLYAISTLAWSGALAFRDVVPQDGVAARGPLGTIGLVVLGILLASWIARRFAPDAAGHGVPEVMTAVAERSGHMRGRVGWVKLVASAVNVGLGGSAGKEGPIVQVGSAFGSAIGRFFAVRGPALRTLVSCGAAAGIAAIFRAPIGGVMFALEIIVGGFHLGAFSPIVIASVAGSITARRFMGTEPMFDIPDSLREGLTMVTPWEIVAYALLGIVGGVASVAFTRALYAIEDGARASRLPPAAKAVVAGVVVGGLGVVLPQVLGEGHHVMTESLVARAEHLPWTLLLLLAAAKVVATSVTIGGGGSGGVFAPSLFVGAMLGGAFGQGVAHLFPGSVAHFGAYALCGMAALLAGTAHAPMTAILLLFELSDNYLLMLPLMTTAVLSTVVASRLMPASIYTFSLLRRGVRLHGPRDTTLLRRVRVADAMRPPTETVPDVATFDEVVRILLQSDKHDFPVVDGTGSLIGALSLDVVREFLREEGLAQLLIARECTRPIETITPQATLLDALALLDRETVYEIPVVQHTVDGPQLIGSLARRDVLRAYHEALRVELRAEAERHRG